MSAPSEPGWREPGSGGPPPEAQDDVDRLYARLEPVAPPREFSAAVLRAARARAGRAAHLPLGWLVAEVCALALLAGFAFWTGQTLVGGGALEVVGALATDTDLLRLMPGDVALAVAVVVPWVEVVLLVAALTAVAFCTRRLSGALAEGLPGNDGLRRAGSS